MGNIETVQEHINTHKNAQQAAPETVEIWQQRCKTVEADRDRLRNDNNNLRLIIRDALKDIAKYAGKDLTGLTITTSESIGLIENLIVGLKTENARLRSTNKSLVKSSDRYRQIDAFPR